MRFFEKCPWKTFFIKKKMDIKKYVHFQKKTINNRPLLFILLYMVSVI